MIVWVVGSLNTDFIFKVPKHTSRSSHQAVEDEDTDHQPGGHGAIRHMRYIGPAVVLQNLLLAMISNRSAGCSGRIMLLSCLSM